MSDYLRALKERKRTLKAQQERHQAQLENLEERAQQIVADARAQALAEREQILAEAKGDPGDDGDVGPMPKHQWKGTRLRFEDGERGNWGKWVDLQGRPGSPGAPGRPGSGANLASLPMAELPVADTDTMVIERSGTLYRVSVADLKSIFGQAAGAVYVGDAPLYMGYETLKMGE